MTSVDRFRVYVLNNHIVYFDRYKLGFWLFFDSCPSQFIVRFVLVVLTLLFYHQWC
jgi:hypothetical protein